MRISFDLDDTLITRTYDWEFEPDLPGFREESEYLRKGTVDLFHWVREQGHEIWIYSISCILDNGGLHHGTSTTLLTR